MKGSPYFPRKPLIYNGMDVHLICRINITAMPAVGSSLSKQTRFYPMINYRFMYGHLSRTLTGTVTLLTGSFITRL
jgi:hypothetical protein